MCSVFGAALGLQRRRCARRASRSPEGTGCHQSPQLSTDVLYLQKLFYRRFSGSSLKDLNRIPRCFEYCTVERTHSGARGSSKRVRQRALRRAHRAARALRSRPQRTNASAARRHVATSCRATRARPVAEAHH